MAGRLPKGDKKVRDAVAARLKKAQKRSDDGNPTGFSDSRRAAQNARVQKRITGGK